MNNTSPNIRLWGIVPAAGLSRRMGRTKQTLPYRNSTITSSIVQTLLEIKLSAVVIVTRTELVDKLKLPNDDRLIITCNDLMQSEMLDSVCIGLDRLQQVHELSSQDGILVVPGDMPLVSAAVCYQCIINYRENPEHIVIAKHKGKNGHPMIFPFSLYSELGSLVGGLRSLSERNSAKVHIVETEDPGVTLDVDTLKQYERLLKTIPRNVQKLICINY